MASDGELNVKVGSSYDNSGLKSAEDALKRFASVSATQFGNISNNVAKVNNIDLDKFKHALQSGGLSIKKFSDDTSKPLPNLPKLTVGINQAGNALQNLSRVAQDAPFGFIGIQNNLNPLLESFQRLKAETGSNALAFKALSASLLGAGGIGLALSVVSSALLLYQSYQQKAAKATEEAAKNQVDAKTALENYIKTLDILTQTQLKGIENSSKEIQTLKQLYNASRNLALPMGERKKAGQELIDQYPKTFANFTAEEIALGKASKAYQHLSYDIISVAKAAARTDTISKNSFEVLSASEQIFQLGKQRLEVESKLTKLQAAQRDNIQGTASVSLGTTRAESKLNEERAAIITKINDLNRDINLKKDQNLRLEKQTTDELVKQQSVTSITGIDADKGTAEKAKKLKSLAEILAELSIELQKNDVDFGKTFGEKNSSNIKSYQSAINSLIENGFKPASSAVQELIKQQQRLVQLSVPLNAPSATNASINPNIKNNITPNLKQVGVLPKYTDEEIREIDANNKFLEGSFASLASSIGQSLANGASPLETFGQSILSSIGDILIQFGKMTLAAGVASSALGKALTNPFNPLSGITAIGAGAALIAIGSAVRVFSGNLGKGGGQAGGKASKNGIPQFADGGLVYGNTIANVGEYPGAKTNPEVIAPLNRLRDMIGNTGSAQPIYIEQNVTPQGLALVVRRGNTILTRTGYNG